MEKAVFLTKGQCESMIDYIECNLLPVIRNDVDIDNMEWLCNICEVYRKLKGVMNDEKDQDWSESAL